MAPAVPADCGQVAGGTEGPSEGFASQAGLDLLAYGDDDAAYGVNPISHLDHLLGFWADAFCRYLDRVNVAQARLAGLQDDLGMSDEMWGLGISAFYIGVSCLLPFLWSDIVVLTLLKATSSRNSPPPCTLLAEGLRSRCLSM
jgi:hypothetical protein